MNGQPERIAVIGSPGGGKSMLAAALAHASGLPLVHLDAEHWQPGWVEPEAQVWRARVAALAAAERWVIDGNYGGTLDLRLARATLVVWLDLPTRACLAGALKRAWCYRCGGRPEMGAGCPERLDAAFVAFLGYIAAFRRRRRPGIVRALVAGDVPAVQIRTVAQRTACHRTVAAHGIARLASSRIEMP